MHGWLGGAVSTVESWGAAFDDAAEAVRKPIQDLEAAKEDFDTAIGKIDEFRTGVEAERARLSSAKADLRRERDALDDVCGAFAWACSIPYNAAIGGMNAAVAAFNAFVAVLNGLIATVSGAKGVLEVAKEALRAVADVISALKVTLEFLKGALRFGQALLDGLVLALEGALLALEAVNAATSFVIDLGHGLVEVIAGIFDVTNVQFRLAATSVTSTRIGMKVDVVLLDGFVEPGPRTTLDLEVDLSDVAASAGLLMEKVLAFRSDEDSVSL